MFTVATCQKAGVPMQKAFADRYDHPYIRPYIVHIMQCVDVRRELWCIIMVFLNNIFNVSPWMQILREFSPLNL